MADTESFIVIDPGTGSLKAGFGSDASPKCVIPSAVAKVPRTSQMFFGENAKSKGRILEVVNPMREGMVANWEDAELFWNYLFTEELRVPASTYPVLMSEPVVNPRVNREKVTEIMMETFGTPAFYLAKQSVLSLRAMDIKTGIAVMSGAGYTAIVPVRDGRVNEEAVTKLTIAGDKLDVHLRQLMNREGGDEPVEDIDLVRDVKEKLCYVVDDFGHEMGKEDSEHERKYQRVDGVEITVKEALFQCPEVLFQPHIIDEYCDGIPEAVISSMDKTMCEDSVKSEMLSNIVLSGGSTMFPNFENRLEKEIKGIISSPPSDTVKLIAPHDRQNLVWRGGVKMAEECTGENLWITQRDYQEHGVNVIVH